MRTLKVATRKSPLALAQTQLVCDELMRLHPEVTCELLPIVSEGDKKLDQSLSKIGGKGLFVKELEQALLSGAADFAVHSTKDLPYAMPEGLSVPAFLTRANPFDAFVSNDYASLMDLPKEAVVGTSSLRRQSLLLRKRPDIRVAFLRGNMNTRLARLDAGDFDAIILAAAGLQRLGLADRIAQVLSLPDFIPAIAQGVLAVQCRTDDEFMRQCLLALNDSTTQACVGAERAVSTRMKADCHWPLAAHAFLEQGAMHMIAMVADAKGERMISVEDSAPESDALLLGERVADELIAKGAFELLASLGVSRE